MTVRGERDNRGASCSAATSAASTPCSRTTPPSPGRGLRGGGEHLRQSCARRRSRSQEQLLSVLTRTFARGGVLLIPAFAVGRAQQMILLDGPAGDEQGSCVPSPSTSTPPWRSTPRASTRVPRRRIAQASLSHRRAQRLEQQVGAGSRARGRSRRRSTNVKGPAVIISSSGMLSGGRILHHCRVRLPHAENTLLITGYQARGHAGTGASSTGRAPVRIHKTRGAGAGRGHRPQGTLRPCRRERDGALAVGGEAAAPPRLPHPRRGGAAAIALAAVLEKERGFRTHVPAQDEVVDLA